MISHYTIYDTSGGILRAIVAPSTDDISDHLASNEYALAEISDGGKYEKVDVNTLEVVSKLEIPYTITTNTIAANGIDVATITDLPAGCIATVNNESEQETEGVIVFGTDLAGVYQILLTHPLALDTILEVTAA